MAKVRVLIAASAIAMLSLSGAGMSQTQPAQPPHVAPGAPQGQTGMPMGQGQMGMMGMGPGAGSQGAVPKGGMGMMGMGGMNPPAGNQGTMPQGGMGMMGRMMGMEMMEMGMGQAAPAPQMQPDSQPGVQQMPMRQPMGQGISGMGRSPMASGSGAVDRVEGRIAFLRAELKISDQQSPAWNEFADALRMGAKRHNEMRQHMSAASATSMSARLEEHERLLNARLESTRSIRSALGRLQATLTEEQKRTLDELVTML